MIVQILATSSEISNCCIKCGGEEIPYQLMVFLHNTINIVMIAIPVLLVVFGVFDFVRAASSQKDDEMKKAQSQFVRRIVASVLVFFVIAITKFLFSTLSNLDFGNGFTDCLDAFVNGGYSKVNCQGVEYTDYDCTNIP